jgi:hypothetical protein
MRVKIFSNTLTSLEWKYIYESSCFPEMVDFYKKEKNIEFVTDDISCTHAILLDQTMPVLMIPKENVVGMSLKAKPLWSREFVAYAKEYIGKYYVGDDADVESLGHPFVKHFSFVPYSLSEYEIVEKTRIMSICVSNTRFSLGNHYCNKIVELIIDNNIPIDIFGKTEKDYRGKKNKTGSPNLFSLKEEYAPTEPFEKYAFSIVIEENKSDAFFSDKVITSIMNRCVPVYYGCDSIQQHSEDVIVLTGNLAKDMNLISEILKQPANHYKEDMNDEKLDKKVNLLGNVKKIFNS